MNPFQFLKPKVAALASSARKTSQRLYAGANVSRLTADWLPSSTSEDSEMVQSLRVLRNRSRQLVRDNEYAKNAVRQVKLNVVGTGVGLQPFVKNARGKLITNLNSEISEVHDAWWNDKRSVHTAGLMNGPDIERFLIGNLVESGEAFVRLVDRPFGDSKIPLALEVLESDRVMDQWTQQNAPNGNVIRLGIEMDEWHRPTAYWCWPVHPGDWSFATFNASAFMRLPANQIIHLYIIDRWPQSRGIPWLHSTMKRLNNMGGIEEAEIVAARGSAAIMGFITTPDPQGMGEDEVQADGKHVDDMEPGQIRRLDPGETFTGWNPSRPNSGLDPFMRLMIRGVAAGVGMSYETLSRDYSQTNYSSARAAQLEDRDLWRVLQRFFIDNFRMPLYRRFMEAAVLSGQIEIADFFQNEDKYLRARFKPRGWTWIDPQKEVQAYVTAVRAGFMTNGDVIAATNGNRDFEDVMKERREELDTVGELNLVLDTNPSQVNDKGIAQPNTAPAESADSGEVEAGEMAATNAKDTPTEPETAEPDNSQGTKGTQKPAKAA
jgi:lambda family phage portal protein